MKTPTADEIRTMIANRDRLADELRLADRDLMEAGRAFWTERGCLTFPRVDALRLAVKL